MLLKVARVGAHDQLSGCALPVVTHSVPYLDLRKKILKGMPHSLWQFQNGMFENPTIRDLLVNPNK